MLKKLLTLIICLLFLSSIADAWLAGYGYRKQFTVQGANLDSNQTHFPIMLVLVDADIDDHCDDDGDRSHDIRFTQSDDSVLDVDWIDYSEAGGEATIICAFSDAGWTINANGSTTGYLYYGNAAAGDPGTDAGVWDANYRGVWHLDEAYNTDADNYKDSSGDTNHGQLTDADADSAQATGKIHNSINLNGDADYINVGSDAELDLDGNDFTFEVWVYPDTHAADRAIIGKHDSDANYKAFHLITRSTGVVRVAFYGADAFADFDADFGDGTWHHVACRYTTSSNELVIYTDGVNRVQQITPSDLVDTDDNDLLIGRARAGAVEEWDGRIDEVRFSDTPRSDDWIEFAYYNVNEADNELTWGGEQSAPVGDYIPKVIIIR